MASSSAQCSARSTSVAAASNATQNNTVVEKKDQYASSGRSGKSSSSRRRGGGAGLAWSGPAPSAAQTAESRPPRGAKGQRWAGQPKRPPARSLAAADVFENRRAPIAEADEFEVGSVFNAGSKKQSLNHLLNFHYEPRGANAATKTGRESFRGRHGSAGTRHKYNKEQYLQANCQFVVKSEAAYDVYLGDPDLVVDWSLIEQVNLKTSHMPSCPICLYPPRAAKITRCGHVFCWTCVLHYLALSDNPWRKCPICYEAVHRPDLKSVVSLFRAEKSVGDEIEMTLMRRDRHSLFAVPVNSYFNDINEKHPDFGNAFNSYSQLLIAKPADVANVILAREKRELEDQYREEKDAPESCFVEEALQYLSERSQNMLGVHYDRDSPILMEPAISSIAEEEGEKEEEESASPSELDLSDSPDESTGSAASASARPRFASMSSDGTGSSAYDGDSFCEEEPVVTVEDLDFSAATTEPGVKGQPASPKETFYFYQSSDGQPIFLHALNVQMLVHQYGGSLEHCPPVIRGRILEKDSTSMREDLRHKLRYLRHLPLTCVFEVCEVQLCAPVVSADTLALFQPQLDQRRRRRVRREREEKRRDRRIQVEADRLILGKIAEPKLRIESNFHFPEVGFNAASFASTLPPARSTESLVSVDSGRSASPRRGEVSFAKMLREGVARPPTSTSMRRSDTFPSAAASAALRPRRASDSEPEPEDYVPPPPQASLGDALAQALAKAAINNSASGGEKKKGKKNKGTRILLTGGAPRPHI